MDLTGWTPAQRWGAAVAPKPPALFSLVASSFVLVGIARSSRRKRITYHRLIGGVSVACAFQSAAVLWGQWAMPSRSGGALGAMTAAGTMGTCAAQGFLLQLFGHAAHLYLAGVCLQGFLSVWHDFDRRRVARGELWIHLCAWVYPLASAIAAAAKDLFRPSGAVCYIESSPYFLLLGALPLIASLALSCAFAGALFWSTWRKERNAEHLSCKRNYKEKARQKKARMMVKQTVLYLATFSFTYLFLIVSRATRIEGNGLYATIYIVGFTILPLQGLLISLVYSFFRVRFQRDNAKSSMRNRQMSWGSHSIPIRKSSARSRASVQDILENREEFAIYDGTNPSSQWAEFILDNEGESDNEFGYGTADETQYQTDMVASSEEKPGGGDECSQDKAKARISTERDLKGHDEIAAEETVVYLEGK